MNEVRAKPYTFPDFRTHLREEFARRRRVNHRYSIRAFGEFLGVDHSTLSQVLRGVRAVPGGCLRKWAVRLKLGREQTELYAAVEHGDDFESLARRLRHMQWMAEATALMTNPAHWRLLHLLKAPDWRPDMRWAAARLGADIDQLNEALSRLLRLGLLNIQGDEWRAQSGLADADATHVIEVGLARLRGAMSAA
jgi:transcriptional regulator with XRE-family HTH domain